MRGSWNVLQYSCEHIPDSSANPFRGSTSQKSVNIVLCRLECEIPKYKPVQVLQLFHPKVCCWVKRESMPESSCFSCILTDFYSTRLKFSRLWNSSSQLLSKILFHSRLPWTSDPDQTLPQTCISLVTTMYHSRFPEKRRGLEWAELLLLVHTIEGTSSIWPVVSFLHLPDP